MTEIAAGNIQAFEQLFFRYQPKLVCFLTGLTHDSELSRDMAQEMFLSIWKDREKLVQVESISAYLYQMARYKVYDYFDHLQTMIQAAVQQMPPQRQLVYRMSREEGLSNDEIALRLHISKRTVENHLTAALAILRKVVYLWLLFTFR